jgi:hypothetical protein
MSTFVYAYRAAADYVPGDPSIVGAWRAWFEELGDAVLDAGNPIFQRESIGTNGSKTVLGGYSIVTAADLASATELAQGCPILAVGGGVEVGEVAEVM